MKLSKKITIVGTIDERATKIEIHDWLGIVLINAQLKELIQNHIPLNRCTWQDIIGEDFLTKDNKEYGGGKVSLDTSIREDIADAICQKLMGRNWPTGASFKGVSQKEQKEFWSEFAIKLVKAGYRLTPNWFQEHLEELV
jgi:hypothetical protein